MKYTDEQRLIDYRATFGTDQGKRVLNDLVQRGWVFAGTLHADALVMAHREGERNMVLEILRYLTVTPDDLRKMAEDMAGEDGG